MTDTTDLQEHFDTIRLELHTAQNHLARIKAELDRLEQQGMYPAIPTEQWQDRDGKGQYLYHLFTMDHNGKYQGPGNKRKVYVGNKPEKIQAARTLATNRARWEQLNHKAQLLGGWIHTRTLELLHLAERTKHWPYDDTLSDHPSDPHSNPDTETAAKGILILARHRPPDDPSDHPSDPC